MMKRALVLGIAMMVISIFAKNSFSATYYVRSDGGTGTQCDGTHDAPYPGTGTAQPCAFNHPNWPLPLVGQSTAKRIAGGDTVVIKQGNYMIGCGSGSNCTQADINITNTGDCYSAWTYDCRPQSIPSGTAANHTKIYGEGYDTGCATAKAQLYGNKGASYMMSVANSSYVDVSCVEITDHFKCEMGGMNPPTACDGISAYGKDGIYGTGSSNISLTNVNIHGLAQYGIRAGGVNTWTLTGVKLRANGYGGWNGDDGSTPGFKGTFVLDKSTVDYNGCNESYPSFDLADCWGQSGSHSGYGDGIGFGNGEIGNWTIRDSSISHNTQDGFDGLHGSGSSSLFVQRSLFEGNAGQPLKSTSATNIENSVIISNCGYFHGQPFTSFVSDCRANTGISLIVDAGRVHKISNSTIVDNTNVAVYSQGSNCDSKTKVILRNNIFYGGRNFSQDTAYNPSGDNRLSTFYYAGGSDGNGAGSCGTLGIDEDYNIVYGFKNNNSKCVGMHSQCGVDPKFVQPLAMGPVTYETGNNVYSKLPLQSLSPAIGANTADETISLQGAQNDYTNYDRGLVWNDGGYELKDPIITTTYYVRPDGGTTAQCTGLADAAYSGSGTAKNCAYSSVFWALPIAGSAPAVFKGGDTLIVKAGNYPMGHGAPNATNGVTTSCNSAYPWDCFMKPIPSGPDKDHPTKILGAGWDTGCASAPQLYGVERAAQIFNLNGSNNIEIQCLEITDHDPCSWTGPNECYKGGYPYGDWAQTGISASDSQSVYINNVNIHGLAVDGIHAGRLKDWTIENSKLVGNSLAGWDGDIGSSSSDSGTMNFIKTTISFNGCAETYPGNNPYGCFSSSQGGYGDGLGTQSTGGDWIFDHVDISHNTSDGLDLLYHNGQGTITIKNSRMEGNAGNQVKSSTSTVIQNSKLIGNCDYFYNNPITYTGGEGFDHCRALGNTLAVAYSPGMSVTIDDSTITGHGDVLVQSSGTSCNGSEQLVSRNNILYGGTDFTGGDLTSMYYAAGATGDSDGPCGNLAMDNSYSLVYGTRDNSRDCFGSTMICQDPRFIGPLSGDVWNVGISSSSPAINKGSFLSGVSELDYSDYDRGTIWDIGALEYQNSKGVRYPPLVTNKTAY